MFGSPVILGIQGVLECYNIGIPGMLVILQFWESWNVGRPEILIIGMLGDLE